MKVPRLGPQNWHLLEKSAPFFVFAVALTIRLLYDLVLSEHRLCSFGDAYFFLKTGQEFAKAVVSAASLPDFIGKLTVHTPDAAGTWATFGSGALGDRLLLDGPIYTMFLAFVQIACGIVDSKDYANNSAIFSIANSLIDSVSCVLVFLCARIAFGARTALVAGLLMAMYPAAVLNTRLCYADLFNYFVLLLWSITALTLFQARKASRDVYCLTLSFMLGALSVINILARSFFAPLPVLGLLILFAFAVKEEQSDESSTSSQRTLLASISQRCYSGLPRIASFLAGFAIVMTPWMGFTHEVTGKYLPWVNRAPGYNLFVGNQLYTDGWRTWPAQSGIPNETKDALRSVSANLTADPVRFCALQLRKESRLWGGVWNDFQHSFFGLGWQVQNVIHDLLLMMGFVGGIASSGYAPKIRRPAIMFAIFALYHCIYAFFEPVARYAVTAMPFVCMLAAFAVANVNRLHRISTFIPLTVVSVVFFSVLNSHFSFIPSLFAILPTDMFMPVSLLDAAIWIIVWGLLGTLIAKLISSTGARWWHNAATWISFCLLALITVCSLVFDPARSEWRAELNQPGDAVKAELLLPPLTRSLPEVSYVLIDMQTDVPSPAVSLTVNGRSSAPPIPVLQLMKDRRDAAEVYALQAQPMNVDPRSYRHWWAFPILSKSLAGNGANEILVTALGAPNTAYSPVRIFGDYPTSQEELDDIKLSGNAQRTFIKAAKMLPSINKFSWVKGFVTIDRRDPRPYEKLVVQGTLRNCRMLREAYVSDKDLSPDFGRQFGQYRIRLFMPVEPSTETATDSDWARNAQVLFSKPEESQIAGGDPLTMLINKAPIAIPKDHSEGAFYMLACDIQRSRQEMIGSIAVNFSQGQNGQKSPNWTSPWLPISMRLSDRNWHKFVFFDRMPEAMRGKDVSASIMISPFPADRLFLHKKQALRDTLKVRNVELRLFPPVGEGFSSVDQENLF